MNQDISLGIIFLILHVLVLLAVIARVLLRPHREPASRIAWIVVILSLPAVGVLAYLLLGETNIGRRRVARMRKVISHLPDVAAAEGSDAKNLQVDVPAHYAQLFQAGKTVNGFDAIGGNRARLFIAVVLSLIALLKRLTFTVPAGHLADSTLRHRQCRGILDHRPGDGVFAHSCVAVGAMHARY